MGQKSSQLNDSEKQIFLRLEVMVNHPKKNYITNITDVYQIGETWSAKVLDLNNCNPENFTDFR